MKTKLKKVAAAAGKGAGVVAMGICVGVIMASAFELTVQGILDAKS